MTIVQLRCFYTVAVVGSFTKAAEQLYMSQSAVSKQIMQLEQELQIPLLNRLSQHIILTQEGRRMFQHCTDILMSLEHMRDDAANFRRTMGRESKIIRLSGVPTMGLYGIIKLINRFINANPDYDIIVEELDEDKVLFNLQVDSCDIAFCSDIRISSEHYKYIPIYHEGFSAAFAKKYWPDQMEEFSLEALWGVPLVLNRQESTLYDHCCNACRSVGFEPNVKMQSSRPEIAMEYILSHPCCYIGLKQAILQVATSLHGIRDIPDIPKFNYILCWKKGHLASVVKRFVDFVQQNIEEKERPGSVRFGVPEE